MYDGALEQSNVNAMYNVHGKSAPIEMNARTTIRDLSPRDWFNRICGGRLERNWECDTEPPVRQVTGCVSRGFLCLMICGVLGPSAFGLDPRKGLTQYTQTAWTQREGLPQDAVNAIAQTAVEWTPILRQPVNP
jgi:hypothetical protein